MEPETESSVVGHMEGAPIYRKVGRFGPYLAWKGAHLATREPSVVSPEQMHLLRAKLREEESRRACDDNVVFGPRRLSPTVDLRRDRSGKAYVRWSPPDLAEVQIRRLDGFPGDPLKSSNTAVLAWLAARGVM